MIEVSRVSKSYGSVRAVHDVTVSIPSGQVTGLLGPNGAGKSTLIRMITSLLTPSSGGITVCGHDVVVDSGKARACIGYLPESAPLYPEMSVEGYLNYRAKLYAIGGAARKAAVDGVIGRCWLTEMRTRRISALSKGYRQRVGLAAAIIHEPKVVILDEPTTGLDPSQIRETRTLIRDLAKGRVVMLSSHILPEVEQRCDRVLIMVRGRLRAQGTPMELMAERQRSAPYVVEVVSPRADAAFTGTARQALEQVVGVASVAGSLLTDSASLAAVARYELVPHGGAPDLRDAIAAACEKAGLMVRELHRRQATLEQVFLSVIEQPGDGTAEGRAAA